MHCCLGFCLFLAIIVALFWAVAAGYLTYGVITYNHRCDGAFFSGIIGLTMRESALFFAGLGTDPQPSNLCLATTDLIKALVGGSCYCLLSAIAIAAALGSKGNKCVIIVASTFYLPVVAFVFYTLYCLLDYDSSDFQEFTGTTVIVPTLCLLTLVTFLATIFSICCCKARRDAMDHEDFLINGQDPGLQGGDGMWYAQ